jgi:hypothetical protein
VRGTAVFGPREKEITLGRGKWVRLEMAGGFVSGG